MTFDEWQQQTGLVGESLETENYWSAYQAGYTECLALLKLLMKHQFETLECLFEDQEHAMGINPPL